ncbi:protein NOI4-like [Lotus japonicus]|uniref:protein NOI4-like n=1 Tax=Lotus japonicus TaxID=34305 RepID=UPI00258FC996|nr:protein NOI4-like [Lotus japonicus]
MASQDKGRPLPKFGEWDVNNPASAEGFTVIFNKARDEKKTSSSATNMATPRKSDSESKNANYAQFPPTKRKWFCCG